MCQLISNESGSWIELNLSTSEDHHLQVLSTYCFQRSGFCLNLGHVSLPAHQSCNKPCRCFPVVCFCWAWKTYATFFRNDDRHNIHIYIWCIYTRGYKRHYMFASFLVEFLEMLQWERTESLGSGPARGPAENVRRCRPYRKKRFVSRCLRN